MNMKRFFILTGIIPIILSCSSMYANIHASLPDLANIPDGTYRGEYSLPKSPLKAVLDVTVENHIMTAIDIIEHSSSPVGRKAESIVYAIINQQSLDIDAISGATGSSLTIKKAVQNALER